LPVESLLDIKEFEMKKRLTSLTILLGIAVFLSAACRLMTGVAATPPTTTMTANPAQISTDTEKPADNLLSPATEAASPALATETPAATIDGQALLQERCNVCHPLSFIYNSRGTPDQWAAVVSIMINNGAVLSAEEEKILDAYLAKNFGQ
jgi:hypothetical protein